MHSTKVFVAPIVALKTSFFRCVLLFLFYTPVCLFAYIIHQWEEKELPDQIVKVVCYVLVCFNCKSAEKRRLNNKHFVWSFLVVFCVLFFISLHLYVPWIRLILVFALNHSDKQKWPLYWTEWNGKPCLYTSKSKNREKKNCRKRQNEIEWVGKGKKKKINRRNKNRSQQKADKWSEEPM